MYIYLWRSLPGPWPAKAALLAVLLAVIVLLLMEVVFPWASAQMPYTNVTV